MQRLLATFCLCGLIFAADKSGVWLDVPFVKQEKNGCGAAAIAMVMQYWLKAQEKAAADADPIAIQRALYSQEGHGIYASDLEHYFQQHGFRTFAFHGTWNDLKRHLEKGRPLIVALKPGQMNADLHYVVVAGIDWEQSIVQFNDPAERKLLKQDRSIFERQWSATADWTLLALPQPTAP
jgi:ABC-type bacteriocin/lantibiotic exporter with double-glycine peptidase domain